MRGLLYSPREVILMSEAANNYCTDWLHALQENMKLETQNKIDLHLSQRAIELSFADLSRKRE